MNTMDAGRARLARSGVAHVFAVLKPFGGDSVGGVGCDLLSFDRLLEFEFGDESVSRVFESPFEPKAVMNDSTVNQAREYPLLAQGLREEEEDKTCKSTWICRLLPEISRFDLPRERPMLRTVVGEPLGRPPV